MEIAIEALFNQMPQFFNAMMAEGINKTIQFDLSGPNGGHWWVKVKDKQCQVFKGDCEKPDLTLFISAEDYLDMCMGRLNAQQAFLTNRLKLAGDFPLAMRMQTLWRRPWQEGECIVSVSESSTPTQEEQAQ